jgi:hypothetical protein
MKLRFECADWIVVSADKMLGNAEGWKGFSPKTLDQGVATHVYASFDPSLKGMWRKRTKVMEEECKTKIIYT